MPPRSLALAFAGAAHAETIRIGVTAGPHAQIIDVVKKVAAKHGLDLKVVEFTDYVVPNQALAQTETRGQLVPARALSEEPDRQDRLEDRQASANTIASPMGVYSKKYKTLAELPNGATVAIPNDPTNGARALLILARQRRRSS